MFPSQADIEEAPEETRSEFCGNLGIFWRFINFFSRNKKKKSQFFPWIFSHRALQGVQDAEAAGKSVGFLGKNGIPGNPKCGTGIGKPPLTFGLSQNLSLIPNFGDFSLNFCTVDKASFAPRGVFLGFVQNFGKIGAGKGIFLA